MPGGVRIPETQRGGRLCIALAAALWSSSGLFAKAPLFHDWPLESRGLQLAFWRALFAGVLLLMFARKRCWSWRFVPASAAFVTMSVCYLSAMTLTTAANAIWLQSTAPWWVFLVGLFLLREPLVPAELVTLVLAAVGVGLILSHEAAGQGGAGIALGLASGAAYAGVVLSLRSLRTIDPIWVVAILHLATAVALLPIVLWLGRWPSLPQAAALVAFGIVQMAVPYVLFARGLRTVTPQEATAIGLIEPVLLPVWVWLAWGEEPRWWTTAGGGLILVGLVLRYLALRRWPAGPCPPDAAGHEQPSAANFPAESGV